MKKIVLVLFFFIFGFLLACSAKDKEIDIFKTSSCNLPCWNEIVVGQTKEEDLLLRLNNIPEIDINTIGSITASGVFDGRISFMIGKKAGDGQYPGHAFVLIKDGIVGEMEFVGGFVMTVNEATDMFGSPEYVYSTHTHDGNISLRIFIPKQGVVLYLTKKNNSLLTQNDAVEAIDIVDLDLFDTVLQSYYTLNGDVFELYSWGGFGNLPDKYPPK